MSGTPIGFRVEVASICDSYVHVGNCCVVVCVWDCYIGWVIVVMCLVFDILIWVILV